MSYLCNFLRIAQGTQGLAALLDPRHIERCLYKLQCHEYMSCITLRSTYPILDHNRRSERQLGCTVYLV